MTPTVLAALSKYAAMGGYAVYIWPSYALAVVCLTTLVVGSVRKARRSERELAAIRQALKTDQS